jgi:ferredoxin
MVTAGWLLQLIRAGVGVRAVACEDEHCEKRVAELEHFVHDLSVVLGFSTEQELEATDGDEAHVIAEPVVAEFASSGDWIELWEPEATNQPLAALGALGPGRDPWRVEGPGCSLGVVSIDAGGCSLCEVCVGVCVSGALRSEPNSAGLRLSVDSSSCTACGACVTSCPEKVVTLTRAVDGALLAAGRRVVATGPAVECATCGAPLVSVLSQEALRLRLGGSPPALTAGTISICADCRLGGRTVTASRRLAT